MSETWNTLNSGESMGQVAKLHYCMYVKPTALPGLTATGLRAAGVTGCNKVRTVPV